MSDLPGLDDAYSLDGPDEVRALYRQWADSFDESFIERMGYVYHQTVVAIFAGRAGAVLDDDEAVLDVGCGTGVVGEALRDLSPAPIDGLDLSPEMLSVAAQKHNDGVPVYRNLIEANVLEPMDIADGSYGGLISAGTFTHGHVGPEAIDGLVRTVRVGGLICLGINEEFFEKAGFGPCFDGLQQSGTITKPELVQVPIYEVDPATNPHGADTALVACFAPTG